MNMVTPPPDIAAISALQSRLVSALRPILPEHALLWEPEDTIPYECDGLAAYRRMPLAVALPETEEQVTQVLRICFDMQIPV
ncbi:MAG: FAD-binding oxidoreductase, partial [Betaproteobacteria bacterium]|nr:FAD-binding oxidoreductase [Betaproteobacteria bacterium]